MSLTSIPPIDPKIGLRFYVKKLKYLRNNGADVNETSSTRVFLRDFLETLDLSKEKIKEINWGLGNLFQLLVHQIDDNDSGSGFYDNRNKNGFDPIIKSLSLLIEQPFPIRYKNNLNSSANNLMKSTLDTKDNVNGKSHNSAILELVILVRLIVDFFQKWWHPSN